MENVSLTEVEQFNKMADTWWDLDGPCKPLHIMNGARMQFIQQQVELTNKKVLDVGCGGGILTETLAQHTNDITGIDASEALIEIAQQHAEGNQLNIQYHNTLLKDHLKEHEEAYDIVTCMELIEHVPKPSELVQELSLSLKANGIIFISTINRNLEAYLKAIVAAEYILKLLPIHTHQYHQFLKPSEIRKMLIQTGLSLNTIQGIDYHPFHQTSTLTHNCNVNYILCAQKGEPNGNAL